MELKGILEKEGYHSILQHFAIWIEASFGLQHDNEPKNLQTMQQLYLVNKQSGGFMWPEQSLDLNPTE